MITRILSILFLLVAVTGCDNYEITDIQSDSFIKFYNPYPVFKAADAKQTATGYVVVGSVETFSMGRQICLLQTDNNGNVVDSARYYGRGFNENAYSLKVLADGFAILGSSENPVSRKLEVYFIRTDTEGNVIWIRTIGGNEDIEAYHFETNSEGDFIMAGYGRRPITGDKQIWLYAISSSGEDFDFSQRFYGGDSDDEGVHLQILSDNRIVVTGYTKSYSGPSNIRNSYILITNSSGGIVTFFPVSNETDETGSSIRFLADGSFLLAGTTGTSDKGTEIVLRKISIASPTPVKWVKTFGTTGNDTGSALIVSNNRYVLLATTAMAEDNTAITIINVDEEGNDAQFFTYGQGSRLSGNNFERTDDNGFVIAGSNVHLEIHSSGVLIKTKPDKTL